MMIDSLLDIAKNRRSTREFCTEPLDREAIQNCILIAGTAPCGANKQPWTFCVVEDAEIKRQIREKAEEIEKDLYENKISDEWRDDLEQFETTHEKPFLEEAPLLIVVFKQLYGANKEKHYYVNESVGLATGMLIQALNVAGINTLTYTPSPMNFLSEILDRPENERPYMVVVCGKAKENYQPTKVSKKELDELMVRY